MYCIANGNPCYCGKTGCVETYISGPALEKRWKISQNIKLSTQHLNKFDSDAGQINGN